MAEILIKSPSICIRSKGHGKRTAEVLFGSAKCFINGHFFSAKVPIAIGIGDTIPARFERIHKKRVFEGTQKYFEKGSRTGSLFHSVWCILAMKPKQRL